jgi:hypothetical protein
MDTQNTRSRKPLSSFIRYCVTHPNERFWQALRNWSGYPFIYVSNQPPGNVHGRMTDTFNFEGKRDDEES